MVKDHFYAPFNIDTENGAFTIKKGRKNLKDLVFPVLYRECGLTVASRDNVALSAFIPSSAASV